MYSMLQFKSKLIPVSDDDIPLPEETSDGDTTMNALVVNTLLHYIFPLTVKQI